ncbi:MAG: phosphoribosylglycinamide formyltransferase [Crocinitomicaceae bacterium]|nr:phosphoribosylglycinamide formyltransferase [Crocinitomicaceae bacterium]
MAKIRIALFASGNGSNAMNLIRHFASNTSVEVAFVLSNKADAGIVKSASSKGIETLVFTNEEVADGEFLVNVCSKYSIDFIVLAGYLRLIPAQLIQAFPERIINIHPALLPKYGGKNMYGDKVHQAIVDANETETGITIHFVNEQFDKGKIIAQYVCPVNPTDSIDDVRENVQHLEHTFFPFVVEKVIKELKFAPRRAR